MELEQIAADPAAGTLPVTTGVSRTLVFAAAAATMLVAVPATWFLKPAPPADPRPIVRFDFEPPGNQQVVNLGRRTVTASPDGKYLAYNTSEGINIRAMDNPAPRVIAGTESLLTTDLFFSPDGEWLAYFSPQPLSLQKIAITGGTPVTIAPTPGATFGATWGPDGNILWATPQGIHRVSANGGTPQTVIKAIDGERMNRPSRSNCWTRLSATCWPLAKASPSRPSGRTRSRPAANSLAASC